MEVPVKIVIKTYKQIVEVELSKNIIIASDCKLHDLQIDHLKDCRNHMAQQITAVCIINYYNHFKNCYGIF